jgi:transposase
VAALDLMKSMLDSDPFITQDELAREVWDRHQIRMSRRTVGRTIRTCLKYSRKRTFQRIVKDGIHEKRTAFARTQINVDSSKVISIDESAFCFFMPPSMGYARRGKRLHVRTSSMRQRRYTLLLAVSSSRVIGYRLFEGSCKSDMFEEFIRDLSVPEGMTHALIDNCSIHTTMPVLKRFADKGLLPMFLSPYSPMLQPIETVFSQLKALFRKTKDGDGWPHPQGRGWKDVAGESISVRIQTALCMIDEDSLGNAFAACWSEAARLARLDG